MGYSSFRYAGGGGSDCEICNTARSGVFTTGYFGATVINVGTTLYTDNALTNPISSYLISDGVHSYTLDGFGVVLTKTLCPSVRSVGMTIYENNDCTNYTNTLDIWTTSIYGFATSMNQGSWYTDACLTTPYNYTGTLHNYNALYTSVSGTLTALDACPTYKFFVGLSNVSKNDACFAYPTREVAVLLTPGVTLDGAALASYPIYYADTLQPVTELYISDGVNGYSTFVDCGNTKVNYDPVACDFTPTTTTTTTTTTAAPTTSTTTTTTTLPPFSISIIDGATACAFTGDWTGTATFTGGSSTLCNSSSVTITSNLGTFDSAVGNNDIFYLSDGSNSRYYQRDGINYTATPLAACLPCGA